MSFERHTSGNDQVNARDKTAETNPQLNLIDLQNGGHNWGKDPSRDNCSADKYLPGLSFNYGGEGTQSSPSGGYSPETSVAGGNNGVQPLENATVSPAANSQSAEAGVSDIAPGTANGGDTNLLQNITNTLQTDLKNLTTVINQFTTDLASADNSLGLGSDTQPPTVAGADDATGALPSDSSSPGGSPSFMKQLQSLMNYLGIPSGNNSSPESAAGTPAPNSDTTAPPPVIANTVGEQPQTIANGTAPLDTTLPATTSIDTVATNTTPATGDATVAALQPLSPQAAQMLTELQSPQSGMSAAGLTQFENSFTQNIQSGQYPDVNSAFSAATTQMYTNEMQNNIPTAAGDQAAAASVLANTTTDSALSTYSTTADSTFAALQAQSPEAAQILSAAQPSQSGMSGGAYLNFETALAQSVNGGQYSDVASAGAAAAATLQQNGDSADSTIAQNVVNSVTGQNGDAQLTAAIATPGDTTTAAAPPADTTAAAPPANNTAQTANGGYNVINGQIIGPDGQPFDAKGVAVYASQAQAEASTILNQMPGLNFIRLAATPGSDTPQDIQQDIQAFQNINPNVIVQVEDHTSGGTDGTTNNTLSGSALTTEENWYSQIAAANINNPNVMFGTANEPNNPFNEQTVVDQEVGIYNAIRSTGNNSLVLMESDGGGSTGPMQADPSAYASMTNIVADAHYYNWAAGYSTDVGANSTALTNEINQWSGITEASGKIPVMIDEYGNSTDGTNIDAGATAAVNAVQLANNAGQVVGAVGWTWNGNNEANGSDAMTQDGTTNTLTTYGQEMINYVNTGATGPVV